MITTIKSDNFSLDLYKKILIKAKKLGYKFPTLSSFKKGLDAYPKFLLLRHDIDVSPLNALKMAEIESSLGIATNYYVRLHSMFYNPAAPPFFDALSSIVDMGHEVGLHYDCSFFKERNIDSIKGVLHDIKTLENILGIKVKSVSQHRPAKSDRFKPPPEYVYAYEDELLNKTTYVSDSGFKWRNNTLMDLVGSSLKIYALIHPTTWAYANLDMEQTYNKTSKITQRLIERQFSNFIKTTNEYLQNRMRKKIR